MRESGSEMGLRGRRAGLTLMSVGDYEADYDRVVGRVGKELRAALPALPARTSPASRLDKGRAVAGR